MAINKFRILRLPAVATIEIDSLPAVVEQEYPINMQDTLVVSVTERGAPFDSFSYQLGTDQQTWSRPIEAIINANVDSGTPGTPGSSFSSDIPALATTDVTVAYQANIDNKTDRFKIRPVSTSTPIRLFVDEVEIISEQEFLIKDVDTITASVFTFDIVTSVDYEIAWGNVDEYGTWRNWTFNQVGNLFGSIGGSSTAQGQL